MITAEKVYEDMLQMPVKEREKLFSVIARQGFMKDRYTWEEVFDDVRRSPFTVREAAGYLKISIQRLGRNILFDVDELKAFKRTR